MRSSIGRLIGVALVATLCSLPAGCDSTRELAGGGAGTDARTPTQGLTYYRDIKHTVPFLVNIGMLNRLESAKVDGAAASETPFLLGHKPFPP